MQAPVVDIMRLGLLILFFGLQYRTRPHSYVRLWFAGWTFVFLSYVAWAALALQWPRLQNVLCLDLLLLGVLTFLVSLLPPIAWRKPLLIGAVALGAMNLSVINMQQSTHVPKLLLIAMILLWHADGLYIANVILKDKRPRERKLVFAVGLVYGIATLAYVVMTSAKDLDSWSVSEVLLCTAVLYWGWGEKKSLARWVGTLGLVGWAGFYFAATLLPASSHAFPLLKEFWSIPKYFVAVTMILKIFEDSTKEQAMMADMYRDLYEDFRLIYETHPLPMWICDGDEGKFLTMNEAMLREYGYSMEELQGMRMVDLEVPVDVETENENILLMAAVDDARMQHRHKDGRVVWVNQVVREITYLGHSAQFVIARDITERLKLDKELSHRAQHDAMTGLPNRHLMEERLQQCLAACDRDERKATLMTIDIDHFKLINDTYGHLVGDECLKAVASRLKSKIRKVDTIARTGGEEFMAIVGGLTSASDAEKVATSLLRVFELPIEVSIGQLFVTVSVGVAVYPSDAADVETLRRLSDEALYRAKRTGRNRAAYASDLLAGSDLRGMKLVG